MVISGEKKISRLAGMGKKMPITMVAFAIGATGMCGIPPVAGFISKWYLCLGTVQAGAYIFLCVILVSSILDVIYFFPIVRMAFFKKPEGDTFTNANWFPNMETQKPLYIFMIVPLAVTASFSIIFCFFPNTFYILDLVKLATNNLFH